MVVDFFHQVESLSDSGVVPCVNPVVVLSCEY